MLNSSLNADTHPMTSRIAIRGDGYVDASLVARLAARPESNEQLVQVFADTIKFGADLLHKLEIHGQKTPEEKQKVIAIAMLMRLLEISESVFILAAYGIRQELRSLFRIFLDAYFLLANTCSDVAFVSTYLRTDEAERLKLMRAAAKHDSNLFRELTEYATADVQNELDQKIRQERIEAFNSFLYADRVGCGVIYDSMYRLCSASVHSSPRCLEEYVETDSDGTITAIIHEGENEVIHRVLSDVHFYFTRALHGVFELFALSNEPLLEFDARREAAIAAYES